VRSICSDLRLVAIAIVIFSLSGTPAAGANQPPAPIDSWLAYGHDAQLTNFVPSQLLTPRTAPYLADKWTTELDGAVVASPLYASGVSIAGQQRDVALFETEAGSIYALDPRDGTIIWHDSFGTVTTPDDACGSFGFSSTPAIDEQRGVVYAALRGRPSSRARPRDRSRSHGLADRRDERAESVRIRLGGLAVAW